MHLFNHEIKTKKPEILKVVGNYINLPKGYSSSTAVNIFGDYVVTFVGVIPEELYEEPLQLFLRVKCWLIGAENSSNSCGIIVNNYFRNVYL